MADQRKVLLRLMDDIKQSLRMNEDDYVENLGNYYDQFLSKAQADLAAMYSRVFRGGTLNLMDYQRLNLLDETMRILAPLKNNLQNQASGYLDDSLTKFYWEAYKQNAWALDQVTPPDTDVSMMRNKLADVAQDPFLKNLIVQQISTPFKGAMFSDKLGVINDDMAVKIGLMTRNAAVNGWSIQDLSQSIRDFVGVPLDEKLVTRPRASAAKYRADMIARTEMMRALNLAQSELYDQNKNLIDGKIWLSAEDGRTCEICQMNDGKTDEEVHDELPAHPNCRCLWIPNVKSWSDLLGPQLGKGMGDLEDIGQYEMKYFNPSKGGISTATVMPYSDWLKVA